jgi:hypothetical protein
LIKDIGFDDEAGEKPSGKKLTTHFCGEVVKDNFGDYLRIRDAPEIM